MRIFIVLLGLCYVLNSLSAQNILIFENFEETTLPIGWAQSTNANDGGWLLGVGLYSTTLGFVHSHIYYFIYLITGI